MKTNQIIIWLRGKAKEAPDHASARMLNAAADKLSELEEELKNEMHRHDRLQDFEVEEAQLLAEARAKLKQLLGCGGCEHCNTEYDQEPCNSCRQDPNFPLWKWKGAKKHGDI